MDTPNLQLQMDHFPLKTYPQLDELLSTKDEMTTS